MFEIMSGWTEYELVDLHDEAKRAEVCGVSVEEVRKGVLSIALSKSVEESKIEAEIVLKTGPWPRFYFSKGGYGGIARKTYLEKVGGKPPTNFWPFSETGHTDEAKKEMLSIFDGRAAFNTPKPTRLIERILHIATDKDSIILDSFAGSGTTAHAVLNTNKTDGGNRKFILIEMGDYADNITAERVKRVINGYGSGKKEVPGTGGSFSYYELGDRLFMEDGNLNSEISTSDIRDYIWYMETHAEISEGSSDEENLLGVNNDTAYYFIYEKDRQTVLDREFLATIKTKAEQYIIYADTCMISEEKLQQFNITFKKIPRDITKL